MKSSTVKRNIDKSNMSGHDKAKAIDYIKTLEVYRDLLKSNELKLWDKDFEIKGLKKEIEELKSIAIKGE